MYKYNAYVLLHFFFLGVAFTEIKKEDAICNERTEKEKAKLQSVLHVEISREWLAIICKYTYKSAENAFNEFVIFVVFFLCSISLTISFIWIIHIICFTGNCTLAVKSKNCVFTAEDRIRRKKPKDYQLYVIMNVWCCRVYHFYCQMW